MRKIHDCRHILNSTKSEMKSWTTNYINTFDRIGRPRVAIIQLGNSPDSTKYVNNKIKHINDCLWDVMLYRISDETTEYDLRRIIKKLNNDDDVSAIILQDPLPKGMDESIFDMIDPKKDLDAITSTNTMNILKSHINELPKLLPCTPNACLTILKDMGVNIRGKNVLILGRSHIVGQPLSLMMTKMGATVTLAHSSSKIENNIIDGSQYDIIISAIGRHNLYRVVCSDKSKLPILLDVGINFKDDGTMCGDFNLDECDFLMATPVPFGVGTVTCAMVLQNIRTLYEIKKNSEKYSWTIDDAFKSGDRSAGLGDK